MITLGLVVVALAAAPAPLAKAQAHLDSGALEDVLFDLDGKSFQGAEATQAALILARAAKKSVDAKDGVFGLQLAQMSLKHDAHQPLALEAGANAALMTEQFETAESYADRWVLASPGPEPRLLRAQIAERQADWSVVVKTLEGVKGDAAERLRVRANSELDQKNRSMSELKKLEANLAAAGQKKASAVDPPRDKMMAIIYSIPGCHPCESVKSFLSRHHISYFVKNVEGEPAAQRELAQKQRKAGIEESAGVPWTDLNGVLIHGFDEPALEKALPAPERAAEVPMRPRANKHIRVVVYASEVDAAGERLQKAIGKHESSIVIKNIAEDPEAAQELEQKKLAAGLAGQKGGKIWIDANGKLTTANSFDEVLSAAGNSVEFGADGRPAQ